MSRILISHDLFLEGIVKAKGCKLYDRGGREYIDLESGIWCTCLGHNHPGVNRAITEQLERVMHLNGRYMGLVSEEAAGSLLEKVRMPDGKCVFLSSGSEAVEYGVQAMRRLSAKPLLITFSESYLSAYGSSGAKPGTEWALPDWSPCQDCPDDLQCGQDCPALKSVPLDQLGGLVLEPGSSSGQVKFPPVKAVSGLAELIKNRGGFLMSNEVTTGLGRTGRWFGYEHYGLRPDIVSLGKGLGNGYPVSAVAMVREVAEDLAAGHFHYSQSHQNDPLGCAVVCEVLKVLDQEGLIARSREAGRWFLDQLHSLAHNSRAVRQVRGRGLMLALEMEEGCDRKLHRHLLEQGLLAGHQPQGKVIRFYPALNIKRELLELVLEHLGAALKVI